MLWEYFSAYGLLIKRDNPAHVHAVTDMAANDYVYDANGSQTTRILSGLATARCEPTK